MKENINAIDKDPSLTGKEFEFCITLLYIVTKRVIDGQEPKEFYPVIYFCEKHIKGNEQPVGLIKIASDILQLLEAMMQQPHLDEIQQAKLVTALPLLQHSSEQEGWKFMPTVEEIDRTTPNLNIFTR